MIPDVSLYENGKSHHVNRSSLYDLFTQVTKITAGTTASARKKNSPQPLSTLSKTKNWTVSTLTTSTAMTSPASRQEAVNNVHPSTQMPKLKLSSTR